MLILNELKVVDVRDSYFQYEDSDENDVKNRSDVHAQEEDEDVEEELRVRPLLVPGSGFHRCYNKI